MMEKGELLAADVLPKVAKEFAKAARGGDALNEALKTTRVQQGRFFTSLQKLQDKIFKGGFGEGFAKLLKEMSLRMEDLIPLAKLLGSVFKLSFDAIRAASSFLITPIETLGRMSEALGLTNMLGDAFSNQFVPKMLAGALLLKTTFGRYLVVLEAIVGSLETIVALSSKGIMSEIERRMGVDIGSEVIGQSLGIIPKKVQEKTSSDNIEKQFSSSLFGIDQSIAEQMSGERANNKLLESINNMFSSSNIAVSVSLDEFGNAVANSQINTHTSNAQAQR